MEYMTKKQFKEKLDNLYSEKSVDRDSYFIIYDFSFNPKEMEEYTVNNLSNGYSQILDVNNVKKSFDEEFINYKQVEYTSKYKNIYLILDETIDYYYDEEVDEYRLIDIILID